MKKNAFKRGFIKAEMPLGAITRLQATIYTHKFILMSNKPITDKIQKEWFDSIIDVLGVPLKK